MTLVIGAPALVAFNPGVLHGTPCPTVEETDYTLDHGYQQFGVAMARAGPRVLGTLMARLAPL